MFVFKFTRTIISVFHECDVFTLYIDILYDNLRTPSLCHYMSIVVCVWMENEYYAREWLKVPYHGHVNYFYQYDFDFKSYFFRESN